MSLLPVIGAAAPSAAPAKPGSGKPAAAKPAPANAAHAAGSEGGADSMFAYVKRDGAEQKLPLFAPESAKVAVATVHDDVIRLEDLVGALAAVHGGMGGRKAMGGMEYGPVLDRIIETRLISAEAREMGMDELPDVTSALVEFKARTGQEMLKSRVLAGVTGDRKDADRRYRDAVREWKVRSVLFGGELDAKTSVPKLQAPGQFERVARQLAAEKKAKGGEEAGWLPRRQMLPQVAELLQKMKVGDVSAPIKVADGYAVMKLEEIRYPDDPKARAEADSIALSIRQKAALQRYYDGLVKKYAKVDRKLLAALDYHAPKPGFEALKKDTRVLASFAEGKPITVGELTEALASGFFHGADRAVKEKKVNAQKPDVFDGLLSQRVVPLQVKAENIEQTPEFQRRVREYQAGLLFSKFVERVIIPKIDINEKKVRAYYDAHRKDFMYPTFYKVESIAFATMKDADDAVKKLRGGTDFKWLNANADGQIAAAKRKLAIEGTLAATTLPKDVAATLAGAKKGDYRLHAGPESQYYAIRVVDVIGATEQPFDEVRPEITQRLQAEELAAHIKQWAGTLRAARPVQIFITRIGS